ncbi:elongator complex protein [Pimephales promelas]|nr:elongator complex protein [Pimephales promelas]
MEAALPEIWSENLQHGQTPLTGPNSTANSITASFQQQRPAVPQQDAEALTAPKMRNLGLFLFCFNNCILLR